MDFENNKEFVKYLYDEYKQDVPLDCICAHYTTDCVWIFGQEEKKKNLPLVGKFFGHDGIIEFLTEKNKLLNVLKWERVSYEDISNDKVKVILDCEYELISDSKKKLKIKETHIHKVNDFQSAAVTMTFDLESYQKIFFF
eukprot:gene7707-12173_t